MARLYLIIRPYASVLYVSSCIAASTTLWCGSIKNAYISYYGNHLMWLGVNIIIYYIMLVLVISDNWSEFDSIIETPILQIHTCIQCSSCLCRLSVFLQVLNTFSDVIWHASWSITGDILAISGGDNKVGNTWTSMCVYTFMCMSVYTCTCMSVYWGFLVKKKLSLMNMLFTQTSPWQAAVCHYM